MAWTIQALSTGLSATTFLVGFSSLRLRAERDRALSRSDAVTAELTRAGAVDRAVTDTEVGVAAQALRQADRKDPIGRWTLLLIIGTLGLMAALTGIAALRSAQSFTLNPTEWSSETFSAGFFLLLEAVIVILALADYRWVVQDLDLRLRESLVSKAAYAMELQQEGRTQRALAEVQLLAERAPTWPWVYAFQAHLQSKLADHEAALTAIARAAQLEPTNPWWKVVRAELLLATKRYEEVLIELDNVGTGSTDASSTAALRGAALYGLGKRDEALAAFDFSVNTNPSDPAQRLLRGKALLDDERAGADPSPSAAFIDMLLDDGARVAIKAVSAIGQERLRAQDAATARADFDFVLKKDPKNPDALLGRGIANYELRVFGKGDIDFTAALTEGVPERKVSLAKARVLHRSGLNSRAEEEYTKALELKETASALTARAFVRLRMGNSTGSLTDFERAVELNPDDLDAAAHYAEGLAREGDITRSDQIFRNTRDRAPNEAHTYWVWIMTLLRTARGAEADAVLDLALSATFNDADRVQMLALAGSVYTELRLFRKAFDAFDEADRILPGSEEVAYRRSLSLAKRGDRLDALVAIEPAVQGKWYLKFAALATRASLLRESGNFEAALEDVNSAIELEPENERIRVSRACLLMSMSRFKPAIDDLDLAMAMNPDSIPALMHRFQARERMGDSEGAEEDFEALCQSLPADHPMILEAKASKKFKEQNWAEAAHNYRLLLNQGENVGALFSLGASYTNNLQFADAEEVFKLLCRDDPSVANKAALAVSISQQGRSDEAIDLFRRLRADDAEETQRWMAESLNAELLPRFEQVMRDWDGSASPAG